MNEVVNNNSNMIPWIDLSLNGAHLAVLRFPDGRTRLVLGGVKDGTANWEWAIRNGYQPSPHRLSLFTDKQKVNFETFLPQFPLARRVMMSKNQVIRIVSPDNIRSIKADIELRENKLLGLNYLGEQVFEGVTGRYSKPEKEGQSFFEREMKSPATFLRAESSDDLAQCADGLVETMVRGEVLRADDLKRFAGIVYGLTKSMDLRDPRLRGVQESVEAAMQRRIEKVAREPDHEAFAWATMLTERQPPFIYRNSASIERQQYSTPLPLAIAVQYMLGDTLGKTLLEPTIGNGSLISCLSTSCDIHAVEIDSIRVDQVRKLRENINVIQGDFLNTEFDQKFDLVVANPPFGGLETPQKLEGLRITRLDHLVLMKSLATRSDQGRAVYIIAADHDNLLDKNAGQISGGSKNLFNWLTDHYHIEGIAEVDGRLYEKMGSGYPVRMVVVGRKRTPEEAALAYQTKANRITNQPLSVLRSWEQVWDFAEEHHPTPSINSLIIEAPGQEKSIRNENGFQAPYVSASKIKEPTTMIPRHMLSSVGIALDALEKNYGTVDEFVSNKLQMTEFDLGIVFEPEQIDAIALSIARIEEGRGFILGDQTGQGKGRVCAAMCRYAALSGKHSVFISEKPNLFTDIWRDIVDICIDRDPAKIFTPFILNDGVSIRGADNKVTFQATKKEVVKKLFDENISPFDMGYNITFATYSQFNRDIAKSVKSLWLSVAAKDSLMVLDESHNAAGESNTALNIASAVNHSWGCVYSSATYAKNAKSMIAYSKVFPTSISIKELPDILKVGGEPLQEILAANLVEDGVMIRREHDFSNLRFETVLSQKFTARNRDISDKLSEILQIMAFVSGDINKLCSRINKEQEHRLSKLSDEQRKGKRIGVSSLNFGSRLYNILRQFQMSILVDDAVDLSLEVLNSGGKPVIVTEMTMESLLMESLYPDREILDDDEENKIKKSFGKAIEIAPLTFRDVLYRVLDKIDIIIERDDYGSVKRTNAIRKAETKEQAEKWVQSKAYTKSLIDDFPDLAVSPVDIIREKIEAHGFRCGEISGRGLMLHTLPDGNLSVSSRNDDRLQTIHLFNNGGLDAVILTRAGSTGISLHASEKFEDQRQRVMIELQIPNNVAERMQFFGRVNRRGQTSSPVIKTLSSGIPCEVRMLAMQNAKLRKLSANTQSNRENVVESKDVPDIINELGNEVAFRFLENNPLIAEQLDISVDEDKLVNDDAWFINKLTGRIALLKVTEQENILDLITAEFNSTLADLDRAGENPFKMNEYQWGAKVVKTEIYDGADNPNASVFEQPVYLSTIEWNEEIEPMRWDRVQKEYLEFANEMIKGNIADKPKNQREGTINIEKILDGIILAFKDLKEKALPLVIDEKKGILSEYDAINSKDNNPVKSLNNRSLFLMSALSLCKPGNLISFIGDQGEMQVGLVIGYKLPPKNHIHLLGSYEVRIAVPGEKHMQIHSVYNLQRHGIKRFYDDYSVNSPSKKGFDNAPSGLLKRQRLVLNGNLFRAAQIASQQSLGRAGIYMDDQGLRQRAIILSSSITAQKLASTPIRVPSALLACELIQKHPKIRLIGNPIGRMNDTVSFRFDSPLWEVCVPGSKQLGSKYFSDPILLDLVGNFSGNRSLMSVKIDHQKLEPFIKRLYEMGESLYAPNEFRSEINASQQIKLPIEKEKIEIVVNPCLI